MHCVESAYGGGHPAFVACVEALAFGGEDPPLTTPDHLVLDEPGTARRSFDVDVAGTGRTVESALSALHDHGLASHMDHVPGVSRHRRGDLRTSRIAGGIDGDGQPFVTVHYRAPLRGRDGSDAD